MASGNMWVSFFTKNAFSGIWPNPHCKFLYFFMFLTHSRYPSRFRRQNRVDTRGLSDGSMGGRHCCTVDKNRIRIFGPEPPMRLSCSNSVYMCLLWRQNSQLFYIYRNVAQKNTAKMWPEQTSVAGSDFPLLTYYYVHVTMWLRWRPKKKWLDNIKEDCEDLNLTVYQTYHLANDRMTWSNTVRNLGCRRGGRWHRLRRKSFKSSV